MFRVDTNNCLRVGTYINMHTYELTTYERKLFASSNTVRLNMEFGHVIIGQILDLTQYVSLETWFFFY